MFNTISDVLVEDAKLAVGTDNLITFLFMWFIYLIFWVLY